MGQKEYMHYVNYKDFFICLTFTTNNITKKLNMKSYIEHKKLGTMAKNGELDRFIKKETEIVKRKLRNEKGWKI